MSPFRSKLSLVSVVGLMLVALAPLWHGDHRHRATSLPLDPHGNATRLCDRSFTDAVPAGTCLVCLSHRLLTHSSTAVACAVDAPVSSHHVATFDSTVVARLRSGSSGARSPPLV